MPRLLVTSLVIFASCSATGCRTYGERGALLGGLTGAAIGGAIGEDSGNAVPAALIGSAVGAVTGGAIGDNVDADLARSRAEIEARMGRQMRGAVTVADVVAMTQAGLSQDVIATHIRANGVAQPPQVNDLIYLRSQGVGDFVIQTMQQAPPPAVAPVVYGPPPGAVVVEHHYGPWYPPPPAPFFHYHNHGYRGRAHWGFSFCR
ncbi:MAG TPA: glycine zipper domain-containing protein [Pirellulaceae bacterium]|nr:glycine zipper domain-containing protein [Pirellulaceae bacterium]